jgi:cytochrome c oxidase subunit 3
MTATTALEKVHSPKEFEHHHDAHHHGPAPIPYEQQLKFNRLGMWLFLISESFLFAGILVMRIVLLREDGQFIRPELDQFIGLIITIILLLSSYFVYLAETAITHNDRRLFLIFLSLAIVMGWVFMAGLYIEWAIIAHFNASDHISGGMFYFMTGIHGFHVLTGLGLLMGVLYNGLKGHFSAEKHWGVEATALYWHFVDVAWVFFYVALYLVGEVYKH